MEQSQSMLSVSPFWCHKSHFLLRGRCIKLVHHANLVPSLYTYFLIYYDEISNICPHPHVNQFSHEAWQNFPLPNAYPVCFGFPLFLHSVLLLCTRNFQRHVTVDLHLSVERSPNLSFEVETSCCVALDQMFFIGLYIEIKTYQADKGNKSEQHHSLHASIF